MARFGRAFPVPTRVRTNPRTRSAPLVVTGTQATETDTASAGALRWLATGVLATETDTANAGAPRFLVAGAQAVETDSANAGAALVRSAGSQATETDTGNAGALRILKAGAQAVETDTANAGVAAEPGVWRPDSDVSNTGWTNEVGSSSNLWNSVDEPFTANDADYVQSPAGAGATVRFTTGNIAAPAETGRALRVRYQAVGTSSGTLYVRVRDGATLVAERSWAVTGGSGWIDRDVALTGAEIATISDPDNLDLELQAVPV